MQKLFRFSTRVKEKVSAAVALAALSHTYPTLGTNHFNNLLLFIVEPEIRYGVSSVALALS